MRSPENATFGNPGRSKASGAEPDHSAGEQWDHSTHASFYDYYAKESQTDAAQQRFRGVRDAILRILENRGQLHQALEVADIGCGAGTQSIVWAELGHVVHALDVNEPLVALGVRRAAESGYAIDFRIGSATSLPWPDESIDVCIALELLEHVADWRSCLAEFIRVVRPGGALFITTSNQLCPLQAEFNLPLYGWYPRGLKRHFEALARTTRPDLANYATYPAVNWFTYYGLKRVLENCGFHCLDRFDMMNIAQMGSGSALVVAAMRSLPPLRFLGQVCTKGTRILALKDTATEQGSL